jgi:hypothetical protein
MKEKKTRKKESKRSNHTSEWAIKGRSWWDRPTDKTEAYSTERVGEAVTPWGGVRFEPRSVHCLTWFRLFCGYSHYLQAHAVMVPRLDHNHFLPNPLQFIINRTRCLIQVLRASLNKRSVVHLCAGSLWSCSHETKQFSKYLILCPPFHNFLSSLSNGQVSRNKSFLSNVFYLGHHLGNKLMLKVCNMNKKS